MKSMLPDGQNRGTCHHSLMPLFKDIGISSLMSEVMSCGSRELAEGDDMIGHFMSKF